MRSAFAPPLLFSLLLQASPPSVLAFQSILVARRSSIGCINNLASRHKSLANAPLLCNFVQQHHFYNQHLRSLSFLPATGGMKMSTSSTTSQSIECNILGGDYAGLSATFSSKTGSLVPVPEHLIPESMLEWGDIPSSFEVLNSENWVDEKDLERTTITVLPEVGCGIDNLEVTKKTETFNNDVSRFDSWEQEKHSNRNVVAIARVGPKLDLETIFQVESQMDEDEEDDKISLRRVRVSVSIDVPQKEGEEPTLSNLITLQVERQTSIQSTKGTAWSGPSSNSGGLDARTVMNTIGKDIVYGDVFAVKKLKGGGDQWDIVAGTQENEGRLDALDGSWMKTVFSSNNGNTVEVQRSRSYFECDGSNNIVSIRLPQNIMVRYGTGVSPNGEEWSIEVSHFDTITSNDSSVLQRRAVLWSLGTPGSEESCSGDACYWIEERKI